MLTFLLLCVDAAELLCRLSLRVEENTSAMVKTEVKFLCRSPLTVPPLLLRQRERREEGGRRGGGKNKLKS